MLTKQVCGFYTRSKFWASSWPNERHAREHSPKWTCGGTITIFYKNAIDFRLQFSPRFLPGSKWRLLFKNNFGLKYLKAFKPGFAIKSSVCHLSLCLVKWWGTGLKVVDKDGAVIETPTKSLAPSSVLFSHQDCKYWFVWSDSKTFRLLLILPIIIFCYFNFFD